jgi:hypothetical protein
MNGLDGWTCSIFRNVGTYRSSDLVLAAEFALLEAEFMGLTAAPCGPDGMMTYVWPAKIKSTNPGWCFQVAGWTRGARTKKKKRLLRKPLWLAGIPACALVRVAAPVVDVDGQLPREQRVERGRVRHD